MQLLLRDDAMSGPYELGDRRRERKGAGRGCTFELHQGPRVGSEVVADEYLAAAAGGGEGVRCATTHGPVHDHWQQPAIAQLVICLYSTRLAFYFVTQMETRRQGAQTAWNQ